MRCLVKPFDGFISFVLQNNQNHICVEKKAEERRRVLGVISVWMFIFELVQNLYVKSTLAFNGSFSTNFSACAGNCCYELYTDSASAAEGLASLRELPRGADTDRVSTDQHPATCVVRECSSVV